MVVQSSSGVSVFNGGKGHKNVVCKFWLSGRCKRNPCMFLHAEKANPSQTKLTPYTKTLPPRKMTWRNPKSSNDHLHQEVTSGSTLCDNGSLSQRSVSIDASSKSEEYCISRSSAHSSKEAEILTSGSNGHLHQEVTIVSPSCDDGSQSQLSVSIDASAKPEEYGFRKDKPQQCKHWVTGNCVHGDKCQYVHSWFSDSGLMMLSKLEGHTKGVTGISLPSGYDKLYSSGKDKSIRVWDCHSGQCAASVNADGEIGCLMSEGQWVFFGLQNQIKALNVQTQVEFSLNVPTGLVCSMAADDVDMLFAGTDDGSILVWKLSNTAEPAAIMKEHLGPVCSLILGVENKLYSGSWDCTIKMWDRQSFQCLNTLCAHTSVVTSLLCWDSYLLSASLDKTIKVWAMNDERNLEIVCERKEEFEVITLRGIHDGKDKPTLLCSCDDNTVRLYDLPSFSERGRIFSRGKVEVIQVDSPFIFTGDATGEIGVWKLLRASAS